MIKIKLDRESCIGCGLCENIAPDYFRIDETGCSSVVQDTIDEKNTANENIVKAVMDAKESCPAQIISIENDNIDAKKDIEKAA